MPDLLEEECTDTHVAASINWMELFPINMSIDGSVQSFIQLLIIISAAAKHDTILMEFIASHGTIIPAGARIYAASLQDAAIDDAVHNIPTPSRDRAGKLVYQPLTVIKQRLALSTAASSPTPLAGPVFTTADSTPTGSLSSRDNIHPHLTDLPPADASGTGLAGPSTGLAGPSLLDADAPDILLSDPGTHAGANALAASRRLLADRDLFNADSFADFQAAKRDATLGPDMLAFHPPSDDTLDDLPPAAIAPAVATTEPARPAADASGPPHDDSPRSERNATSIHPGSAANRFPTTADVLAADALPANSPYKIKRWLLLQLQRDLAIALRRIIADSHLADKLYGDAYGLGFAMLVRIQKFIVGHMVGPQAMITANFARSQIINTPMILTSSNCTHTFLESVSKYREVSQFCPALCNDADLVVTLRKFLDYLPDRLGPELRTQILMYKSSRQSGDASDSDDDNASSTQRSTLLRTDLVRALKEHDRSVCRKAEALKLNASIADLASKPAQTAQLSDLHRQVKALQDQLALRQACTTSSTKRPTAASAPSPPPTARALAVAPTATRARTNTRTKDYTLSMRDCVHCHGRHMDKDCTSRPHASTTSASGGPLTSSPPPPPRDLRPPAASTVDAPTAVAPPHTKTLPEPTPPPDAKTPALAISRVTFRRALRVSPEQRPPPGLPPDPTAAQFVSAAAGEINRKPALFSGRLMSTAIFPATATAAKHTRHHLRVDVPPLLLSVDSKRPCTHLVAYMRAALSKPARASISSSRCTPPWGHLAAAFKRACTALLFAATRICAAKLYVFHRMFANTPATSTPPPTPALLHKGSPPPPPPVPTRARSTPAPGLPSPSSSQGPASPRQLPHGAHRPQRA